MHLVDPGQRVVLIADVYGGVYRMTSQIYEPKGYRFTYVPAGEFDDDLASHLDDDVRLVWLETPSNPLLNVVDIRRAADAAHAAGALLVVDNTFATPYLQQPLSLGADLVVHSTTKYLGGHSDTVGGFVATNDDALAERLYFLQKSLGAVPGPFDSWLVLRGIKTLAVRMRQHSENARRIAAFLDGHPGRRARALPGPRGHPGPRGRAQADARLRWDGLVPRPVRAGGGRARRAHEALQARRVAGQRREPDRAPGADDACIDGVAPFAPPPNLVRLSVGIESVDDLVADLEAALVRRPRRRGPDGRPRATGRRARAAGRTGQARAADDASTASRRCEPTRRAVPRRSRAGSSRSIAPASLPVSEPLVADHTVAHAPEQLQRNVRVGDRAGVVVGAAPRVRAAAPARACRRSRCGRAAAAPAVFQAREVAVAASHVGRPGRTPRLPRAAGDGSPRAAASPARPSTRPLRRSCDGRRSRRAPRRSPASARDPRSARRTPREPVQSPAFAAGVDHREVPAARKAPPETRVLRLVGAAPVR